MYAPLDKIMDPGLGKENNQGGYGKKEASGSARPRSTLTCHKFHLDRLIPSPLGREEGETPKFYCIFNFDVCGGAYCGVETTGRNRARQFQTPQTGPATEYA